jgi:hypothetical protein
VGIISDQQNAMYRQKVDKVAKIDEHQAFLIYYTISSGVNSE